MIAGGLFHLKDSVIKTQLFYRNCQTVEIISLIDSKFRCEFSDTLASRRGAIGGLLKNRPVITGGDMDPAITEEDTITEENTMEYFDEMGGFKCKQKCPNVCKQCVKWW